MKFVISVVAKYARMHYNLLWLCIGKNRKSLNQSVLFDAIWIRNIWLCKENETMPDVRKTCGVSMSVQHLHEASEIWQVHLCGLLGKVLRQGLLMMALVKEICSMVITVAIPCYKSSKTLPSVVDDIQTQFRLQSKYTYQIVLVNDGSPDGGATLETIQKLCEKDPRIIGVDLSKNFGQAAAKMAALPYVEGDVLVYMDDDGQHEARGIFDLVEAVEAGADMAIADFRGKKHTAFKRLTSWINTQLLCLVLQKPKDIHTSSFAAYSKFLIEQLREYKSPFVATFAFVLQNTNRIVNVPMEHHERLEGQSGYTLKKLLRLWSDGIFSFSTVPLRMIGVMGGISAAAGLVLLLCSIIAAVCHGSAATLVILGCLFLLGGVVLFGQSLLGAYLGRIYLAQNSQPQYKVRSLIRCAEKEAVH